MANLLNNLIMARILAAINAAAEYRIDHIGHDFMFRANHPGRSCKTAFAYSFRLAQGVPLL